MAHRRLGETLAAHVRTWRPYTLWYVGLVGLAGCTLAGQRHTYARLAAAWLVPTLIWVAAHYLGDYLDRRLDAISKPHRPIPSGQLRPSAALACGALLACCAAVIALVINWLTVILIAGGIAGAISYNGFFKARGGWGNLVRGALTGAAFIFGEMMASQLPLLRLLPFVLMFCAHDAASNLVGSLRDVCCDRAGGYSTFAVRHGIRKAAWTAVAAYLLAVAAAVAGLLSLPHARATYLIIVVLAAGLAYHAFRMLFVSGRALSSRTALRSHEVLVVERLVLADALLVPSLGLPVAMGILVPLLAVTIVTQHTMRSRHEFAPPASARLPGDTAATPAFLSSGAARPERLN